MTQIDNQDTTSIDEQLEEILGKLWNDAWGKLGAYNFDGTGEDTLTKTQARDVVKALISDQVAKARIEWLDEQISHLLQDIYPTDLFAEPTQADFDRINKYDANLHTRLHCDGIRHGLHILRREVRGLSARDELATLNGVTL